MCIAAFPGFLHVYTFITVSESVLRGYDYNSFVGYDDSKSAVMSDRQTVFQLIRPGLTNEPNTISMMSFDKPGWYLRNYNGRLYLEPKVNPRDPKYFDSNATFVEHKNTFYDGFLGFESVSSPGYYMAHNGSQGIYFRQPGNTTDSLRSSSFADNSEVPERKKRAAGEGELTFKVRYVHYLKRAKQLQLMSLHNFLKQSFNSMQQLDGNSRFKRTIFRSTLTPCFLKPTSRMLSDSVPPTVGT